MKRTDFSNIRKAVIPAAGFGTRFLPFTRAVPKEMIPLVDKPVIQYVVEEAAAAGIEEILIITSSGKEAMQNHFLPDLELEKRLEVTGKSAILENLRSIQNLARLSYVEQSLLNGLGGALLLAEEFVNGEPFAVLLGDTVVESFTAMSAIGQLMTCASIFGGTVTALEKVPHERLSNYGIVGGDKISDKVMQIRKLVEKPSPEQAPSDMAIASRYVLSPAIFDHLRQAPVHGAGQEIYLTDALMTLSAEEPLFGYLVEAHRYDIGNKLEFLKATVEFGLRHADGGEKFLNYLKQRLAMEK